MNSPFDLDDEAAYLSWRARKLAERPRDAGDLLVEVARLDRLSAGESARIRQCIKRANMVLLQCTNPSYINKEYLTALGGQLGLLRLDENPCADEDAISTLSVSEHKPYIPYTNRPLSWHTDGYYNDPEHLVRAWLLLCRSDALDGGDNQLLDHEILYIALRDRDPAFIRALSAADAMTIPANVVDGVQIRPARTGPVFSVDAEDGALHMRYSARTRNIQWKQDPSLQAALSYIEGLFSHGSTYIYRHRMKPGQCLVSNNVLHNRSGFRDSPQQRRVIYRARYHERIQLTG
jgi:alpha-ketoglutarate-dependent taurine dioxygenase